MVLLAFGKYWLSPFLVVAYNCREPWQGIAEIDTKTYDYFSEILNLIVRIILTLVIELGLFFLFRLYSKRNFKVVLITNLVTQIFLNVVINIALYNSGYMSALFLLFALEFVELIIEFTAYQILLKEKKRWVIILYPLIANALSFGLGLFIFRFIF